MGLLVRLTRGGGLGVGPDTGTDSSRLFTRILWGLPLERKDSLGLSMGVWGSGKERW